MCCRCGGTKSMTGKRAEGRRGEGQKRQGELCKIPLKSFKIHFAKWLDFLPCGCTGGYFLFDLKPIRGRSF